MTNEARAREVAKKVIGLITVGIEWGADPVSEQQSVIAIILTTLNAATAELEEERGRLREALKDAAIALAGAASAYSAYAGRSRSIKPRAKPDPFYTTRVRNLQEAADHARSALAKKDPSNG